MSDALLKLRDLGAQKIHDDTHILIRHIEDVLNERYENLTRVQFLGFISILEREYLIDLSSLKSAANSYYNEQTTAQIADDTIFVTSSKNRDFSKIYIAIILVVIIALIYFNFGSTIENEYNLRSNNSVKPDKIIENNTTSVAKEEIKTDISKSMYEDSNNITEVDETNITDSDENSQKTDDAINQNSVAKSVESNKVDQIQNESIKAKVVKESKPVLKEFEIKPRYKVWLGYIDVSNHKKTQKIFSGKLDLDTNKEWILLFGHRYVDVIIDGKKKHYSGKGSLRLHYKNSTLKEITIAEFKKLNRGKKW